MKNKFLGLFVLGLTLGLGYLSCFGGSLWIANQTKDLTIERVYLHISGSSWEAPDEFANLKPGYRSRELKWEGPAHIGIIKTVFKTEDNVRFEVLTTAGQNFEWNAFMTCCPACKLNEVDFESIKDIKLDIKSENDTKFENGYINFSELSRFGGSLWIENNTEDLTIERVYLHLGGFSWKVLEGVAKLEPGDSKEFTWKALAPISVVKTVFKTKAGVEFEVLMALGQNFEWKLDQATYEGIEAINLDIKSRNDTTSENGYINFSQLL